MGAHPEPAQPDPLPSTQAPGIRSPTRITQTPFLRSSNFSDGWKAPTSTAGNSLAPVSGRVPAVAQSIFRRSEVQMWPALWKHATPQSGDVDSKSRGRQHTRFLSQPFKLLGLSEFHASPLNMEVLKTVRNTRLLPPQVALNRTTFPASAAGVMFQNWAASFWFHEFAIVAEDHRGRVSHLQRQCCGVFELCQMVGTEGMPQSVLRPLLK